MENKYYTPEIEEFKVGFEYEQFGKYTEFKVCKNTDGYYSKIGETIETIGWKTKVCGEFDFEDLEEYLETGLIRTKYLNQEDIESLGFKEDIYNGVKCFTNNNCQIFFFPHNTIPDHNIISIDLFAGNYRGQYFRGFIKNKSELKRILKQITNGI